MKNKFKLTLLSLISALVLGGCGSTPITSSQSVSSSSSSSQPSSSSSSAPSSTASTWTYPSDWVDYTAQVHLEEEYDGCEFLEDGIGEVTLFTKIDGDTAHFKQISGDKGTIKGRYNCIDTPESTGMIEPWGKGASNFNGKLLTAAKHIVLSTDDNATTKPAVDSTGGRYLVYVWVAFVDNPELKDFVNVNLAICQEGWSKAKGASGTALGSYFTKASVQAQKNKLHVWSSEKDPDFNYDDPVVIDMKMIVDGVDSKGQKFDWIDKKVTFTGIVVATGPDKGAAYLNKDFTVGSVTRRYGIYIFTSYQTYEPLQTIGNEVQVTGIVASYNGSIQVVGVSYSKYYPSDDDMKIISKDNFLEPIEATAGELAQDKYINVIVKADLYCTGGYKKQNTATKTAYSFTLYCKDYATDETLNIYIVDSIAIKDGETRVQDLEYFKNAEHIEIIGALSYFEGTKAGSYQVKLCTASNLTVHTK